MARSLLSLLRIGSSSSRRKLAKQAEAEKAQQLMQRLTNVLGQPRERLSMHDSTPLPQKNVLP